MNPQMLRKLQKMQKDMAKAQKELDESVFEATAGGGMVKVEVKGNREILSLDIDKDAIDPEDKDILQDTILAAINDAMRQIEEASSDVMGSFTGGMGMPGLF
ncbi:YbaB/EbfC family nucleoid-associated protein [Haloplasma contractile]|uniref:Nucleoid-associated protein HLPCO_001609 n=1 Tax=Haloplasma contractile SSD-17B TaxID=1033810 RepID=F7PWL1_9MOLU|nr:YbaB/EbfC family nucleoid-associated protein [Haloplasma contractile]ERJ12618.1 Nucleoid-associated protein YaaK [Haloplasma contractile SSD-17B]